MGLLCYYMPGYAGIEGTPNRIGQPRGGISILEGGEGMRTRIAELRWKEVVDVQNGSRFGYVEDLEVDLESGQVRALVLPGRRRLFGLLGREEDTAIPWGDIEKIGTDVLLVRTAVSAQPRSRKKLFGVK